MGGGGGGGICFELLVCHRFTQCSVFVDLIILKCEGVLTTIIPVRDGTARAPMHTICGGKCVCLVDITSIACYGP